MARKRQQTIEFGNLVCRFGQHVLIDKLAEIVAPAFFGDHARNFGETSFFFYGVEELVLTAADGVKYTGIAGRLIKNTRVRRDQIFTIDGLVKDTASLASAPSSFFLLILDTHRLIYVRETPDAPYMSAFRSTLHTFLRREHTDYVNRVAEESGHTKVSVSKDTPRPSLQLIPLTSDAGIDDFITSFQKLTTFEISIKRKNDEIDDDQFFEELDRQGQDVGATSSVLKHKNAAGLDIASVTEKLKSTSGVGQQIVKLKGFDFEGDVLQGNNENFQLKRPIEVLPRDVVKSSERLFGNYLNLSKEGLIKVPPASARVKRILRERNE